MPAPACKHPNHHFTISSNFIQLLGRSHPRFHPLPSPPGEARVNSAVKPKNSGSTAESTQIMANCRGGFIDRPYNMDIWTDGSYLLKYGA